MKKLTPILIVLVCCLSSFQVFAQHKLDSLKKVLNESKLEDTVMVNTLNSISILYWQSGNYDTAMAFAKNAQVLSVKLGYNAGLSAAFTNIGKVYYFKSNYPDALNYTFQALKLDSVTGNLTETAINLGSIGAIYDEQGNYLQALNYKLQALAIFKKTGDKPFIAKALGNVGIVYDELGNYPQALDDELKALDIAEQVGDKRTIAINLGNIANIYNEQHNYARALEYDLKALPIVKEIGNKYGIASTLSSIGSIYHYMDSLHKALQYDLKALALDSVVGNSEGLADDLGNTGNVYYDLKNMDAALKFNNEALAINRAIDNKSGVAEVMGAMAKIFTSEKKYPLAKSYFDSSLVISGKMGDKSNLEETYFGLSKLDSVTGDLKLAWINYKTAISYHDSMLNEGAIRKTTQAEMSYMYERKIDSAQNIHDRINAINEKEKQRLKTVRNSLVGGFFIMLLASIVFFIQRRKIAIEKQEVEKEKKRSDELLLNILPEEVAEELKEKGSAEARHFDDVTVMFTDFKGFTTIGEKLSPRELVAEINHCFVAYDYIIHKYGIEKIKTIGDAYMAVCGLPNPDINHAEKVVSACLEIVEFMEDYKTERIKNNQPYFEVRIGINSGSVVAGIVGIKKFAYDIWGDAVNIAARMEQNSEPGRINISGTTFELVKDKFKCDYRGKIEAKNKGEIDMYFAERRNSQ